MHKQIEGFILSGQSFDFDQSCTLKLYGQSDNGAFLVTINQFKNYFFAECKTPSSFRSLDGVWGQKFFFQNQSELKLKKKQFEDLGLRTFEADIRPLDRYLMDQEFYAQVTISGEATFKKGIWVFENPKMTQGTHYPKCSIFSFDIETGKDGRLYSLAYSFCSKDLKGSQVFMLGEGVSDKEIRFCRTEKELLIFFQEAVQKFDPDIITGWNVIGFDFHFLEKK